MKWTQAKKLKRDKLDLLSKLTKNLYNLQEISVNIVDKLSSCFDFRSWSYWLFYRGR